MIAVLHGDISHPKRKQGREKGRRGRKLRTNQLAENVTDTQRETDQLEVSERQQGKRISQMTSRLTTQKRLCDGFNVSAVSSFRCLYEKNTF